MQHIPEVLKIIEGGIKSNSTQVISYAKLLADKLEQEGMNRAAENIRRKIGLGATATRSVSLTGANSSASIGIPVDRDSRLTLGDESAPRIEEHPVQLPDHLQATIEEFLSFIDKAPLLAEAGVGITPSMLIYGPPGCGKTELANHIAARLELPLLTARCDTLISSFLGSTAKNLRSLFDHAASRPCVLFLDEFDAFAKARDDQHELGELKRVVVSLLQNIDALPEETILIAATNHEDLLDLAVWRRFAYRLHIPLPDREVRLNLFNQFLGNFKPESCKLLADATEGFNGAIIEQACKTAMRNAVIRGSDKVDIDTLVLSLIKDQYRNILTSNISDEQKALTLRTTNKKIFTLQRISALLGISVGKLSKLLSTEVTANGKEKQPDTGS